MTNSALELVEEYQSATAPFAPDDALADAKAVRAYFSGVSDMTLWRWLREREFPEPRYIAGRRFWRWSEVRAWENQEAAKREAT